MDDEELEDQMAEDLFVFLNTSYFDIDGGIISTSSVLRVLILDNEGVPRHVCT